MCLLVYNFSRIDSCISNNTLAALFRNAPLPQAGSTILIFLTFRSSSSIFEPGYSLISSSTVFILPDLLKYGIIVFLQM